MLFNEDSKKKTVKLSMEHKPRIKIIKGKYKNVFWLNFSPLVLLIQLLEFLNSVSVSKTIELF